MSVTPISTDNLVGAVESLGTRIHDLKERL
jgi:hypothetical protein